MPGSYIYILSQANELCHNILSSATSPGINCHIYKDVGSIDTETYSKEKTLIEKFTGGVVFMQVSMLGGCFMPYNTEENTLAMTLAAYMNLLHFFKTDYKTLVKRMEEDVQVMQNKERWIVFNPFIKFRGPADICYTLDLDTCNDLKLTLVIYREGVPGGKMEATLKYNHAWLPKIKLPLSSIDILSHDKSTLAELLDYKEEGMDVTY